MCKVYRAIPKAPDERLGYVQDDGSVFRTRLGLDDRLGRVDLASGRVYEDRFGPDKEIGHVDLGNGKVYLRQFGPDEYAGRVDGEGRMYRHVHMAADDYIGKVEPFLSYAHSAAAMLLLVLPALEAGEKDASPEQGE